MWSHLLDRFLRALVRKGSLAVTYPDGTRRDYGDGSGSPVGLHLHDESIVRQMLLKPELAAGEGYMEGRLSLDGDDLHGFLSLVKTMGKGSRPPLLLRAIKRLRKLLKRVAQHNPAAQSRRNVAHHYDLSGELYDLFLDEDRQYSCAYYARPDMTLEEAQAAKKAHIAAKMLIEPGMRVLDIGCGWGGMGLLLAAQYGAEVTGVTLSEEQYKMANARAEKAGLADRARFELTDYRDVQGQFDRIVSVGMFEHVGVPHYHSYFEKIRELLTDDGVAVIHTIGRSAPPSSTNPWIAKYIFPGGYVPALSEVAPVIEREGLMITDLEVWRLHYADTLRHWLDRFDANIDKARALYDETFCRMWRFYLVASEMSFRDGHHVVFQFQLTKRHGVVPVTRDYLCGGDGGAGNGNRTRN